MNGPGGLTGRVALVTGGGGGIGGAVAVELARQGAAVVVNDSGVAVGGEPLGDAAAQAVADRITTVGGRAAADTTSVTDREGIADLVGRIITQWGSLDVLVTAAGIIRPGHLGVASDEDWRAVLETHLDGHLNCLEAVMPVMAGAGYGRIVTVTSGAGLARVSAESVPYGTAKRAVAALTWQLGEMAPPGVTINALSPIAATRMVPSTARPPTEPERGGAAAPALDFGAMPRPEFLAPAVAHLCHEAAGWLNGTVVFTNGTEISVISPPRLADAVQTGGLPDPAQVLEAALAAVVGPAERVQTTTGGGMPRLPGVLLRPATEV